MIMMNSNKPGIPVPSKISQILLEKYPDLSPAELKICALLSSNMSSRSVADITNRSVRTVENTRNNIRKKMKLTKTENLVSHLIRLSGEKI
jgi:DNA-binding CsgD family transcriptional regulator